MSGRPSDPVIVPASRCGWRMVLGRNGWLLLAGAIILAGAALSWGWLTVIGATPRFLALALAPCAVMCGLGAREPGGKTGCTSESRNSSNPNGPEKAGH